MTSSWWMSCRSSRTVPTPILDICMILKRTEGNVKRILVDMEELGLVERIEISIPGRKARYGWKKAVHDGDSKKVRLIRWH